MALFEAIQLEIPFFIPSREFLKYFIHTDIDGKKKDNFFWSPPLREEVLHLSEWYNDTHTDLLIYFDSWEGLRKKVHSLNYDKHKLKLKEFGKKHIKTTLNKWESIMFALHSDFIFKEVGDMTSFVKIVNIIFHWSFKAGPLRTSDKLIFTKG